MQSPEATHCRDPVLSPPISQRPTYAIGSIDEEEGADKGHRTDGDYHNGDVLQGQHHLIRIHFLSFGSVLHRLVQHIGQFVAILAQRRIQRNRHEGELHHGAHYGQDAENEAAHPQRDTETALVQ